MSEVQGTEDNYKWKVLGVVMVGTLMSALDSSIVNVSIPAIMADFGSSLDDIEWVITSYMLAFAALMPLTAWLRDRVGHKWLYTASLVLFTIGSVLCGVAWNLPTLIFARVVQAVGGGAITPTGMAMISESFEPHERGKALGFWGMGAVMGPAFGPTIGGYLTKSFGWPSIFLVNLPIGILGVIFALKILKNDRPSSAHHKPFDAFGFAFLTLFLISFLLGLSKGESEGWTSTYIVTCGLLSVVGFGGFLLVESIVEHKIINLSLLNDPTFASCFVFRGVMSLALYGGTFLLPVFLQTYKGLDEVQSGLILLPGSLLMGLLMPVGGRLGDKLSPRLVIAVGFLFLGLFFFNYRNIGANTSNWDIILPTMLRGVGVAMLSAPLTALAMNAVSNAQAGMASSMLNIMQQVGGSAGIAILSLILHRRGTYHLNILGTNLSTNSEAYQQSFQMILARAHEIGYNHAQSARLAAQSLGEFIARQSGIFAFQDSFLFAAMITFAVILGVFALPAKPIVRAKGAIREPVHME